MGNSFSPHNLPKRACALTLAGALALPLGAALAPAALAARNSGRRTSHWTARSQRPQADR